MTALWLDSFADAPPAFGIALELLYIRTGLAPVRVLGVRCLEGVTRF